MAVAEGGISWVVQAGTRAEDTHVIQASLLPLLVLELLLVLPLLLRGARTTCLPPVLFMLGDRVFRGFPLVFFASGFALFSTSFTTHSPIISFFLQKRREQERYSQAFLLSTLILLLCSREACWSSWRRTVATCGENSRRKETYSSVVVFIQDLVLGWSEGEMLRDEGQKRGRGWCFSNLDASDFQHGSLLGGRWSLKWSNNVSNTYTIYLSSRI